MTEQGSTVKRVAVLYATREGHTRRIAEHVAATLRTRGLEASVRDVRHLPVSFTLGDCVATIVAASVHAGHHEREMVRFVQAHRAELEAQPTAFLSVSLTEAGAESPRSTPEIKARAEKDVRALIDEFFKETGWHPARVRPVAGALLYQQYGFLKRFVLRTIAGRSGGDTDTSRDYEYTDWEALDHFVGDLVEEVEASRRDETVSARGGAGAR
jgi:menaquinone-dependent protoporphyrinogen oxidase